MTPTAPPHASNGVVDVAIIGAGPTGLFAAFYAGLRQMSIKLIDSLDILGGQLNTLYPEKYIYDVAGFPRILAKELVLSLVEQAMQYGPTVCLGEQVMGLEEAEPGKLWKLKTSKFTHMARSIIIAGGLGAFQPKTLGLPNAQQYQDRGLFYFVKDISSFKGKR
ncbi:MAG TPA: NAD(P)/FAD-dependent oxidoreductase, partial [Tepidisphaeraceae bacterium]|nr:NAD(P)/FAD-dependent oxidoreductase [Tepidisphaeraceae bacterium]